MIEKIAREIYRVLKLGGKLFLSVASEKNTEDKDHKTLKPIVWWRDKFKMFSNEQNISGSLFDWQVLFLRKE